MMKKNNQLTESTIFKFFFIKPVFAILLICILIVSGLMGYSSIIKEQYPDPEIPMALIITEWAGAPAEIIEKEVTAEIEKEIKSLKGLKRYKSASRESASVILVEFEAEASISESMRLLRAKIYDAQAKLPKEVELPEIEKFSVNNIPVATFAIIGDVDDHIIDSVTRKLEKRLERVSGIRKVERDGNREEIVRVEIIPERIIAMGISPTVIRDKLVAYNKDMPWGEFENKNLNFNLKMKGAYRTVEEIKEIPIVRIQDDRVIRLHEVANVFRDVDKRKTATYLSWQGGDLKKAVIMSIFKTPGRDTIEVVEKAEAVVAEAVKSDFWPEGLTYKITSNETEQINTKLSEVYMNGLQAMGIVGLILLALLTWREALIAGLSIPMTFLGTLAVLLATGQTLNQMVIIGMVIALGMLVDVFILVMEGMHDAIYSRNLSFKEAALDTLQTYALPAFAGQLTTILALVPLFFIKGIDGKFIRIIPLTTVICLIISYVLAFVIDIPLSKFLLKGKTSDKVSFTAKVLEKVKLTFTSWLLSSALKTKKHALAWVFGSFICFCLSMAAAGYIPQVLYPKSDGRNMGITVELEPDTLLEDAESIGLKISEKLRSCDYLNNITFYAGKKSPFSLTDPQEQLGINETPYILGFSCLFTQKNDREKMGFEYSEEMRAKINEVLKDVPGAVVNMAPELGGATNADPVRIDIVGEDIQTLRNIAYEVTQELAKIYGVVDPKNNAGAQRIQMAAIPQRENLDFHNIDQQYMGEQVRIWMDNDEMGKFRIAGIRDDLDIKLGTSWKSRKGEMGGPLMFEELDNISIFAHDGKMIPATALIEARLSEASQIIMRKDGLRSVTVMSKTGDATVDQIINKITPVLEELQKKWPSGYTYSFSGEKESAEDTYDSVGQVFVLALFLVFSVLAILFGSFSQPVIIMCTVPFAIIGVFGGFFLFGLTFSFMASIGLVSLVGIVVNNAIIMVETMNKHISDGFSVFASAVKGTGDRFRPILATTLTTTSGLIPLALGSAMWMPMAMTIIFGLILSTIVSLVLVPCLFVLFTKEHHKKESE